MKLFTTAEVAKILSLPRSRVHSFVRAGFIAPSRNTGKQLEFTFQDLLLLKAAKALFDSQMAPKKIMRMLGSLKRQLPGDQHLSRIKIYVDGQRIIALDGNARWQPDSGQFVFNFDAQALAKQAKLARELAKPTTNVGDVSWSTSQHLSCTAPMGADDDAAVDRNLVEGISHRLHRGPV